MAHNTYNNSENDHDRNDVNNHNIIRYKENIDFDELLKKRDRSWMTGGNILEHLQTKYAKCKVLRSVDLSEESLSPEEKNEIGRVLNTCELGAIKSDFEKRFKLGKRPLREYERRVRDHKFYKCESIGGRPRIYNKADDKRLEEVLIEMAQEQKGQDPVALRKNVFFKVKEEVNVRNGMSPLASMPSPSTCYRHKKRIQLKVKVGQGKSHARIKEEAAIRNFVTLVVLFMAFGDSLDPHMKGNWDATQYRVGIVKQKTVCMPAKCDLNVCPTYENNAKQALYIKQFHLHNAGGMVAPLVLVVADPSVPEGQIKVSIVSGMSNSLVPGAYGYLVFCSTRNCNSAFYKWFVKDVIVPWVDEIRRHRAVDGITDKPLETCFLTCDGEKVQLDILIDDEIRQLLNEKNILIGKTPASCSGKTQTSDTGDVHFKGPKTRMKYITQDEYRDPVLEQRLKTIIKTRNFTAAKQHLICMGIMEVVKCIQQTYTSRAIEQSYIDNGQLDYKDGINIKIMLSKCSASMSLEEYNAIVVALPTLKQEMIRLGHIEETTMDGLNIPGEEYSEDGTTRVPKDQRAMYQERSVLINHDAVIDREVARVKRRADEVAARQANAVAKIAALRAKVSSCEANVFTAESNLQKATNDFHAVLASLEEAEATGAGDKHICRIRKSLNTKSAMVDTKQRVLVQKQGSLTKAKESLEYSVGKHRVNDTNNVPDAADETPGEDMDVAY